MGAWRRSSQPGPTLRVPLPLVQPLSPPQALRINKRLKIYPLYLKLFLILFFGLSNGEQQQLGAARPVSKRGGAERGVCGGSRIPPTSHAVPPAGSCPARGSRAASRSSSPSPHPASVRRELRERNRAGLPRFAWNPSGVRAGKTGREDLGRFPGPGCAPAPPELPSLGQPPLPPEPPESRCCFARCSPEPLPAPSVAVHFPTKKSKYFGFAPFWGGKRLEGP